MRGGGGGEGTRGSGGNGRMGGGGDGTRGGQGAGRRRGVEGTGAKGLSGKGHWPQPPNRNLYRGSQCPRFFSSSSLPISLLYFC